MESVDQANLNGFEIAVVGMACRFPDAGNVDEFWDNILAGRESVRALSEQELARAGLDESLINDPDYINSGSFLEGIENFDANLFSYSAKEADLMDPQHRLFLHVVWEALENAACAADQCGQSIGVFAGAAGSSYLVESLSKRNRAFKHFSVQDLMYENNHDLLSTRVSYKLNLNGPSVVIGSACSTSLVVVHYACQSLIAAECDIAVAGAARVSVPQKSGYYYAQGGILSRDGHCRAFDKHASGTISGSGVGAVVLKRLSDARIQRDNILAVIKGTAINNDGSQKVGFTAPSVEGQVDVIKKALLAADVTPDSIGYIEAHGTGTALGDPIELSALTKAFSSFAEKKSSAGRAGKKSQYCAIGTVKSNIGHLDAAAGMASLIKTIQALNHKQLPPSVNYENPNGEINLEKTPFYINTEATEWIASKPRRAAVSAFGIGGTNAHIIIEENQLCPASGPARRWQLFCQSAKTKTALRENLENLSKWLACNEEENIADAAYTLHTGRMSLENRCSFVCENSKQAIKLINAKHSPGICQGYSKNRNKPVVFMFSGQGTQYEHMGADLYRYETVFRHVVDECAEILKTWLRVDIRDLIYPSESDVESKKGTDRKHRPLYRTKYTQPALFVIEYALVRLLESWGVTPKACMGHSVGEYVAACVAGVFDLQDALFLVAARGRCMEAMPEGAMLSVQLSAEEIDPYLNKEISLAAVNAPDWCVVSGETKAIDKLEILLASKSLAVKKLHTSHAYHSHMMEPCLNEFEAALEKVTLRPARLPYISNLTGGWITQEQATSKQYWRAHLRFPVLFAKGIETLNDDECVFLEVGPGRTLALLAELQAAPLKKVGNEGKSFISTLKTVESKVPDDKYILSALGQLWCAGVNVDWRGFYGGEKRRSITLPTYSFQCKRHWLDVDKAQPEPYSENTGVNIGEKKTVENWFYQYDWRRCDLPERDTNTNSRSGKWLVFMDEGKNLEGTIEGLSRGKDLCWQVNKGKTFRQKKNSLVEMDPENQKHYEDLIELLKISGEIPDKFIHASNLNSKNSGIGRNYRNESYYSLLYLAKAMAKKGITKEIDIFIVSNQLQNISGLELVDVEKSLLIGPCKVIPKEYINITCKSIDVDFAKRSGGLTPETTAALLAELQFKSHDKFVALRNGRRFVQQCEKVQLIENGGGLTTPYRRNGVYLITGGFGGIGSTLAEHLCKNYQANVILISRTPLPTEKDWNRWLANHGTNNKTSRNIKLVKKLTDIGGKVFVITDDAANHRAMHSQIKKAEKTLGRINGVMHSAGIADGALIQGRDTLDSESVFTAKVEGTRTLSRILRKKPLDFFILCSSLSSYVGPIGQVAYCSANAYMDAFACSLSPLELKKCRKVVSIGWDSWKQVGMAVDSLLSQSGEKEADALDAINHGIEPKEGLSVLERILAYKYNHLITSTRDLKVFDVPLNESAIEETSDQQHLNASDEAWSGFHERPELPNQYVTPQTETERKIAAIWQEKFGIYPIGIEDDFFELNGHSLLAVQIVTEIKRQLNAVLGAGVLYESSTIAKIAGLVDALTGKNAHPDQTHIAHPKRVVVEV